MASEEIYGQCASCGSELRGKHCYICGEKKISKEDLTVKNFVSQAFEIITHFDSKIWRSVYLLILRPGYLVTENLSGRRIRYAKPIQLFLVINIIYFLVLNYIGYDEVTKPLTDHMNSSFYGSIATSMVNSKLAESKVTFKEYDEEFYNEIYVESKLLIAIMISLFALWCYLIFRTQHKLYYEHLVFSTYLFCFILLFYTFFLNTLKYLLLLTIKYDISDRVAEIIVLVVSAVYMFLAIKEIYKFPFMENVLKTFLSIAGLVVVVVLYRFILFLIVFYTL